MPAPAAPGDNTHDRWGNPARVDSRRTRRRPQTGLHCLLLPGRTECKAGFRAECRLGQDSPTSSARYQCYQCMPRMDKWGQGNLLWLTSDNFWPHIITCPLQHKLHGLPSPSTHPTTTATPALPESHHFQLQTLAATEKLSCGDLCLSRINSTSSKPVFVDIGITCSYHRLLFRVLQELL